MIFRLFFQTMLARRMLAVALATSTALVLAVALLTGLHSPHEALAREGESNPHGFGRPAAATFASFQPSSVMTLTGELTGTGFGYPVASAGDVNGDGYADVIVGALGYYSFSGRIYVYHGSASGLNPTPVFTATGEAINDQFGYAIGTAGDVNGDGYDDAIVGAYEHSPWRAYVYLGSASGLNAASVVTLTGDVKVFEIAAGTAGDVNGDGYDDVIVGVPDSGRAYVYMGAASGLNTTPALTLTGAASVFGKSAGGAGDINGDGYAEVIIGEPGYIGQAHVYMGTTNGLSTTPAVTLTGETIGDAFGSEAETAGDINSDGYSDIIVGAATYTSTTAIGRVYAYLGSVGGLTATPAFTATGEAAFNNFGYSAGTAGDVNGDGYDDVVVGAPGYQNSTGRAYLYLGSANGLSATPAFTATGETAGNAFGVSAGMAGDVNGDGVGDFIVGANHYDNARGRVYLYFGIPNRRIFLPLIQK
jgi:hypothetical protein